MAAGDVIFASDSAFRMGVVARGRRITNTGTFTTTETGVLRVDNVPVFSGRTYRIAIPMFNMDSTVTGDFVNAFIRVSTSGAATTASTQVGFYRNIDLATSAVVGMLAYYLPAADGTASFLFSAQRAAGTGNVTIQASSGGPLDMLVIDENLTPADTGVVL